MKKKYLIIAAIIIFVLIVLGISVISQNRPFSKYKLFDITEMFPMTSRSFEFVWKDNENMYIGFVPKNKDVNAYEIWELNVQTGASKLCFELKREDYVGDYEQFGLFSGMEIMSLEDGRVVLMDKRSVDDNEHSYSYIWGKEMTNPQTIRSPIIGVSDMVISKNGKRIVQNSQKMDCIYVYDIASMEEIARLENAGCATQITDDGKYIVAGFNHDRDFSVGFRVLDLAGNIKYEFVDKNYSFANMEFAVRHQDGRIISSPMPYLSEVPPLRLIINLDTGECETTKLPSDANGVHGISSDGVYKCTFMRINIPKPENFTYIYDIEKNKKYKLKDELGWSIESESAWSNDNKHLALPVNTGEKIMLTVYKK